MQIITGGADGEVRHWTINGEKLSSVPSSLSHIFSLSYNSKNKKNEVGRRQFGCTVRAPSNLASLVTQLEFSLISGVD